MNELYTLEQGENITILHPAQHRHTLIWLHGLNMHRDHHIKALTQVFKNSLKHIKIVLPQAPLRDVTVMQAKASSWFDVKFRGENSLTVPFDEAFSSAQVKDSYEQIIKPIIEKERVILDKIHGKLIVSGFSQGCGMSLHCLYNLPETVDAVVAIAGYFLGVTEFKGGLVNPVMVIHGLNDKLRPWEQCKLTYDGKIPPESIALVNNMAHEISETTKLAMEKAYSRVFQMLEIQPMI